MGWGDQSGKHEEGAQRLEGRQAWDSDRTEDSSSQRAAKINELLLYESLTELSKAGIGPPSFHAQTQDSRLSFRFVESCGS